MNRADITKDEFMQQLGSDPRTPQRKLEAKALQHSGACPDAELRLARALKFEQLLDRALHVEPPPELTAQLLAITAAESSATRDEIATPTGTRRRWLALAAGVSMLALGGLGGYYMHQAGGARNSALVQNCSDHLSHEPFALVRTEVVPKALVQRMLVANGFDEKDAQGRLMSEALGDINYLAPCSVGGVLAMHMVVQTSEGPVTVLLMRKQRTEGASESYVGSAVARVSPLNSASQSSGAMVLLAESGVALDRIEARFLGALNT